MTSQMHLNNRQHRPELPTVTITWRTPSKDRSAERKKNPFFLCPTCVISLGLFCQQMTLKMVKTATPWIYGNDDRVVRLSKLQGMPQLRETIATWEIDRVHDVTVKHVQLGIKARKLLGENHVPVGALKVRPVFFLSFFLLGKNYVSVGALKVRSVFFFLSFFFLVATSFIFFIFVCLFCLFVCLPVCVFLFSSS